MISIEPKTLRRLAFLYFAILMTAMWCPTGSLSLNNMVLGFRLDHLLHAAIYMPCAFAWSLLLPRKAWLWFPLTLLVGAGTESVQYLLPYRGFDISDMIANANGALIGWVALLIWRKRH